jgi:hypothetical protein
MDVTDINRLLESGHYSPADLEQVDNLCRNYPMFNLAHVLKVRIMEALGHDKETALKKAAVYAADRRMLRKLVTEVTRVPEEVEEPVREEPEGIRFSDEPHWEADVIIVQHAPYAGPGQDEPAGPGASPGDTAGDHLLELDEEEPAESFSLEAEEENLEEDLMEGMEKDDVEMEEPGTEGVATPVIDAVDPGEGKMDIPDEATPRENNNRLILNFIREDPGPIRSDLKTRSIKDVSLASIREHDGFITDTLAQIYVKQGLYAKAIYAYEKLSLKYPEKSAYFAAQIEKIRNINRS